MAVRGSQALALLGRHPYLPGAAELLGPAGAPTLRELVTSPVYEGVRAAARATLEQAAGSPAVPVERTPEGALDGPSSYLSFQYCRMLLAMPILPRALYRRWCLHIAKSSWGILGTEAEEGSGPSSIRGELPFLAAQLGMSVTDGGGGSMEISLPSYLHMASQIREGHFRLAKQRLDGRGHVLVTSRRAARLLQEGIRLYLLTMPPLALQPALVQLLEVEEGEFLAELSRRTPLLGTSAVGAFNPDHFPPCIREMRAIMQRGENLSHFGRFTLAAFLHRIGANLEYLIECYRGAPDFDEDVTRYQLEHITTHDDGKGYTPPECATVVTNGLCFKERDETRPSLCLDPNLRRPMNYYIRRGKLFPAQVAPSDGRPVDGSGLASDQEVEKKQVQRTEAHPKQRNGKGQP